jgi:hypothetical protein
MYVVARRTIGTWSDAMVDELINHFRKLPKRPAPRIWKQQHYLIVLRPCRLAWLESAARVGVPYRSRRQFVVSRPMLGLPKKPDGNPDFAEVIRRFKLKLKEPPAKPRKLFTRVSVEHTERPWTEESLQRLLQRIAGRSGRASLYHRVGKPERFTLPGRVAWSYVDELIRSVVGCDGSRFGYEIVRSQDEPEKKFGELVTFNPAPEEVT